MLSTSVKVTGKNIANKIVIDSTFANIFIPLRMEMVELVFGGLQQITYKCNNFSIKIEKK